MRDFTQLTRSQQIVPSGHPVPLNGQPHIQSCLVTQLSVHTYLLSSPFSVGKISAKLPSNIMNCFYKSSGDFLRGELSDMSAITSYLARISLREVNLTLFNAVPLLNFQNGSRLISWRFFMKKKNEAFILKRLFS